LGHERLPSALANPWITDFIRTFRAGDGVPKEKPLHHIIYLLSVIALCTVPLAPAHGENPIQLENRKPGALDWQLTRVRVDKSGFRSPWIEGYCSHQSVQAGDVLQIMVSTAPAARFKIEVFRTGYYGGAGARLMTTLGPFQGKEQPVPPVGPRRLRECRWEPATSVTIPGEWLSGVYLGRLTTLPEKEDQPYWQSYVVFIVRDSRAADILFQCSDNTWQAYNRWPDSYSVYTDPKGNQGPWSDVSFDRPYAKYAQIYDNPQSIGSGEWLCFEFPLAYWLEQQGYDVSYCSNSDMHTPERGLKCKAFLSVAHDEYWDRPAYDSVQAMRDAGVNLLFLSGNAVCWVTPLKPSTSGQAKRIMFRGGPYGGKYKWAEDREQQNGPFPERGPDEGYLIGARNVEPVNGGGDWVVTKPEHWIFAGTGMKKGDRVPGLVGWEYHGDPPTDLAGLEIVGSGTAWVGGVRPQTWTATIYPGPKGNIVFNASSIFWAQDLSAPPGHMLPWSHWSRPHGPDARVQQITHNVLRRALGSARP
jgi:hypothetical protein